MKSRPSLPHRAVRLGGVALVVAYAAACATFIDEPSVRIADVRLSSIGLSGATADVVLEVTNPNGFTLSAEALRYSLGFEDPDAREAGAEDPWRVVARGETDRALEVEPGETEAVTLSVPFGYDELGRAAATFLRTGEVRYRLRGDVLFDAPVGNVRVPFEETGRVGG